MDVVLEKKGPVRELLIVVYMKSLNKGSSALNLEITLMNELINLEHAFCV